MTTTRRQFIGSVLAASAGGCAPPVGTAESASTRVPGIQLYTVRDAMANDVEGTLQAIAGIGYRAVEFAGYHGHPPPEIRAMLRRFDLAAPSTHVDPMAARSDPAAAAGVAAEVGHDYAVIAWLPPDTRSTADDYRAWADACNRLGEACRAAGLRAAYHNHDFEFEALSGSVPFDILMKRTDPELVDFELDFYWVRKAGLAIDDVLGRAPERFALAHIKDFASDGEMVDVGRGTIDFRAILAGPAAAGIRHCFVEHDQPADPFRSAAYSHFALREVLAESG